MAIRSLIIITKDDRWVEVAKSIVILDDRKVEQSNLGASIGLELAQIS